MPSTPESKKLERIRQEGKVVEGVVSALQNHLDEIRRTRSSESFQLTEIERERLWKFNNSGLFQGLACGAVAFASLRFMRASLLKRIMNRQSHQHPPVNNSTVSSPFMNSNQQSSHVQNSPFTQPPPSVLPPPNLITQQERAGSNLMGLFGWVLDGMVSLSVAATGSLYFTDVKGVLQGLAEFPKLQGGSTVADEFCPTIISTLEKLEGQSHNEEGTGVANNNNHDDDDHDDGLFADHDKDNMPTPNKSIDPNTWKGQPVESMYLKSILQFAQNCQQYHSPQQPEANDFLDNENWTDSMTDDQDNNGH